MIATSVSSGGAFSASVRYSSSTLGRLACRPGNDAADDLRADGIEHVIDAGHDAEVPAATPQPPEEVSVFVAARTHQSCVGGHDVHPDNVVRRPAPTPGQVAEATAQSEACDAGERDETEDGGESRAPAFRDPRRRADNQPAHGRPFLPASTHTPRISDMSSISAPSAVARPAMLCPPPLMQSRRL